MINLNLDEQKKKILIIGGIGVLLVADIFFIFFPLIGKTFQLRSEIVSIKKNIAVLNQQIAMRGETQKKLEALKNDQARFQKLFPKEEEVPALLGELSTVAGKLGVDIISVRPAKTNPGAVPTPSFFHEVIIEMSGRGGYHQIGRFINKLEMLDKFISIQDIEITTERTTPRVHIFRILLSTYILRT